MVYMLPILFYDGRSIRWVFSTGRLYPLFVTYAFDFCGLAELKSAAWRVESEAPTRPQLEVSRAPLLRSCVVAAE